MMQLIFGFDIGTTSIGSAVIRYDARRSEGRIEHLGTRIFPEARDPDGTPLNQQRRIARTMRRQVRRRRERRKQLNSLLAEFGFLPRFNSTEWSRVMALDPYQLRKEGLERALTPAELGRAIYHLSKRRHFRGRDLEEGDAENVNESADEKEAKSGREKTIQALKKSNLTLGSYLYSIPDGHRKRGIHANRDHVQDEFNRLMVKQSSFHPILSNDLQLKIADTIFAQKPVFWRKNTLGECRLIPRAQLAPKASWPSIQKRMLEKLNNLAISGGNGRPLEPEERQAILDQIQIQGSMTWVGIRRVLEPIFKARGESAKAIRFNLEEGGEKGLPGNPLEMKLLGIFSEAWHSHPHKQAIREAVDSRLRASDYGDVGQRVVILREAERKRRRQLAAESFSKDFGATPSQVKELEKLTFATGWDAYSYEALDIIIPELEEGHRFGTMLNSPDQEWYDWRNRNFPNRHQATGEILDRLPSPNDKEESQRLRNIRNPTVVRVQNELRKVVNNLISVYGKPDLVRIEMTRDIGLSKAEREEKSKAMRNQEKLRKAAIEELKSNGIAEPKRDDIEKCLLWKESGGRDPYSGDHISFAELFLYGQFEVEHIWPRSKSLDDSFANKTLCRKDMNLRKSNLIPYDAFHSDPDLWSAMKDRVSGMLAAKGGVGMSRGKIRRFLAQSMPDDFVNRQLNDTGYAARQSVTFLKRLWPDVGPEGKIYVQSVNGKVTAHLRRLWGLNNVLSDDGEKTRADHRHHAIDALVVACADPGISQRLSRYWQLKDNPATASQKPQLDPPWLDIRAEAERAVKGIVVSHRVRRKISGPLHTGSIYGDTKRNVTVGNIDYRVVVERVALSQLSLADLLSDNIEQNRYQIVDQGVRKMIEKHLRENGLDVENYKAQRKIKATSEDLKILDRILANAIPFGDSEVVIRKVRVLSRKQPHLLIPVHNGLSPEDSNHHIALYKKIDGTFKELPVSLNTALARNKRGEPIIEKILKDGSELYFSLSKGDIIEFEDERSRYWVVRMLGSNGQIRIVPHNEARPDKAAIKYEPFLKGLIEKKVKKVSVDPIGRIRPAND